MAPEAPQAGPETASRTAAAAAAVLPTAAATREQFVSIVWLRAIASLMVVWTHLVSIFGHAYNVNWLPLRIVEKALNEPLGLVEGFSIFGVDIFFVISGFVITHAALGETRTAFAVKRMLRIYPALLLSLVIASLTLASYLSYFGSAFPSTVTPTWTTFWQSLSLLHVFFHADHSNINPVAWTLVLEVVFYFVVFLTLPLLKRRPGVVVLLQIGIYALAPLAFAVSSERLQYVGVTYSLMFLLYQGQALYLYRSRRISLGAFVATWAVYYLLYAASLQTTLAAYYRNHPQVAINAVLAFVLFAGLLSFEGRLRVPRVVRFFADISYSLYLNHAVPGFILLALLYPRTGYSLGLAMAFALSVGLATVSFYAIERPSQRLARYLTSRPNRPARPESPTPSA